MPRNRTTNHSAFVQLKQELSNIKAEINPSIRTFRPPAQPSPIKEAVDGKWSYGRFRVNKTIAANGGSVIITTGNVAAAIGLSKVDFQIDRCAFWLLGSPEYQSAELSVETGAGLLPTSLQFTSTDYGSAVRPAAIGMNLPRALTLMTNGATSGTTGTQFTVSSSGAGLTTVGPATIVADLWVLYRQSA